MQINPDSREFTEALGLPLFPEVEEDRVLLDEAMQKEIVALSYDKEVLKKLQDDLRKAGYKRRR